MSLTKISIYLVVLFLCFSSGLYRWRRQDRAMRILVVLVGCTLVVEFIAFLTALHLQNNSIIYHVFGPFSLILISLYYQLSIPVFQKYKISIWLGGLGILAAILNILFFQSTKEFNSNFILFMGLCVIALGLYSFIYIAKQNKMGIRQQKVFWVSLIFLIFWSCTFLCFALFHVLLIQEMNMEINWIYFGLWCSNIFQYCSLALLFYLIPSKLTNNNNE